METWRGSVCGDHPFDFNQQFPAAEISLEIDDLARCKQGNAEGLLDGFEMIRLTDVYLIPTA